MVPLISILIPAHNEEKILPVCLDSVMSNDYPKEKTELFIIDGKSTDNTLQIAIEYMQKYPCIKIISNEKKIFPAAINHGIKNSRGEILFILGAHAEYSQDYFSKCVNYLLQYNADNIGGVLNTVARNKSFASNIITFVLSNPFGVGNSAFRTGVKEITEVDTVFGGCYRREAIERTGLFNENLISSSDIDYNKRLRKAGGKILLIPEITITYYTRSTLLTFLKNNFRNGFWSVYPIRFVDYIPVSIRHLVPLVFVSSIIFLMVLFFWAQIFRYLLYTELFIYFVTAIGFSWKGLPLVRFHYLFFLPMFFFFLHLTYGIGSLWACIKIILKRL